MAGSAVGVYRFIDDIYKNVIMMNTRPLIVLALLLCLSRLGASAQDDDSRRWAIDFRLSPVKPVVSLNETPDKYYDPVKAGGGPNFSAHIEYFIPQTGFSVVGGYDHEVMDFYSGDVSADLSQIMLGGRWYFLSKSCPLQPYLGASTFWNVAGRKDAGTVTSVGSYNYVRNYSVSSPVLSVAPVVGLDIYLFSCVALEVDYGFRLAVDGHTSSQTTFGKDTTPYAMRSPMHRHALSVGLKVTFPFKFTSSDFSGLLDSLLDLK